MHILNCSERSHLGKYNNMGMGADICPRRYVCMQYRAAPVACLLPLPCFLPPCHRQHVCASPPLLSFPLRPEALQEMQSPWQVLQAITDHEVLENWRSCTCTAAIVLEDRARRCASLLCVCKLQRTASDSLMHMLTYVCVCGDECRSLLDSVLSRQRALCANASWPGRLRWH